MREMDENRRDPDRRPLPPRACRAAAAQLAGEESPRVMPQDQPAAPKADEKKPPKCKACCACPETKRVRDECIVRNGEENCQPLIEAHKQCMRDMGFNI
ncbi:cytochrome c oxidase copper chaperone-like [Pollicipes pollicipes]|uniref:cytochrome c oxidase copper chaperone-like n=1 Tax=Pollicipes pollicipes TaxID=41117 RepID=UPI0018851D95|nr:cytochrome c oxidase copper chaperone-like [Pollicipes pollicipes]